MLLKVFVKRKPGGEPVMDGAEDQFYEAPRIMKWTGNSDSLSYEFYVDNKAIESNYRTVKVDERTHGYELYNDSGVMVVKFVTPYREDQIQMTEEGKDSPFMFSTTDRKGLKILQYIVDQRLDKVKDYLEDPNKTYDEESRKIDEEEKKYLEGYLVVINKKLEDIKMTKVKG